ncbi:MAG: chromate resistance protein ChrB domain-containing protein [Acetobacteraceae bacterium]
MRENGERAGWLLLLHQLPAKPAYARVKLWRRLQALGAVAVKNAAYALPASPEAQEDLEWALKEITAAGGEAVVLEARLVDGLTDAELRAQFSAAREADFATLAGEIRAASKAAGQDALPPPQLARLKAEASRLAAIDFFGTAGRITVEALITELAERSAPGSRPSAPAIDLPPKGSVWVTRRDVHVDRIASAWLIRRWIDAEASFRFVSAKGHRPRFGEVRFDMFNGEFTHEGDRCTFEVLLQKSGLNDPALNAIGEIVHDIDLKDAKFDRAEAEGIAALIDGLARAPLSDAERIEQGAMLFNNLYASLSCRRR